MNDDSERGSWQYKYVERFPASDLNHDSLTFDTLKEAQEWMLDNATRIAAHNSMAAPSDLIAPAIIKRFVPVACLWEPVLADEYPRPVEDSAAASALAKETR